MIDVDLDDLMKNAFQYDYRVGRCRFCGRQGLIVDQFPRRGYGQRGVKWKLGDERYGEKA